jgi:hypothetical protein
MLRWWRRLTKKRPVPDSVHEVVDEGSFLRGQGVVIHMPPIPLVER